jgi:hypothetical protein
MTRVWFDIADLCPFCDDEVSRLRVYNETGEVARGDTIDCPNCLREGVWVGDTVKEIYWGEDDGETRDSKDEEEEE